MRPARSVPTGFLRIRGIHRHRRNEAIPVRHFDLRQSLGVKDVALLDDAVLIEQKRDERINFVRFERSWITGGHRAVDIVPGDRRIREVAWTVLFHTIKGPAKRLAGTARHQMVGYPVFAILAVAYLAALRKDRRPFLGGPAPDRKLLSLRADHVVEVLDF